MPVAHNLRLSGDNIIAHFSLAQSRNIFIFVYIYIYI